MLVEGELTLLAEHRQDPVRLALALGGLQRAGGELFGRFL
jgi:hypothetical protein